MIINHIINYLNGEGKTLDESFTSEFGNQAKWAVSRQFGKKEERNGNLRLSSIGRCTRQQAYKVLGFPENGKELDARAKMVFLMGDLTEQAVIAAARAAGCDVTAYGSNQTEIEIDGFVGHPDALYVDSGATYLVEVKSMSSFSFKDFEKGELEEGYRYQINAYLYALKLTKCIVIALNKDAGVLSEMLVSRDDVIVTDIKSRIKTLKAVSKETLPERPYEPNEKGRLPWNCLYCGFWGTCWPAAQKILVSGRYKLVIQPKK